MKCPHCLENFHGSFYETDFRESEGTSFSDKNGYWRTRYTICPSCKEATIFLQTFFDDEDGKAIVLKEIQVWPKGISRPPLPPEVTDNFDVSDYREACLVLTDSPKASAALSRRCLQHLLHEKAGVKKSNLSKEIDEVLSSHTLPSGLADAIDAIRNIGNFAAHPIKSTNTGEIVDVEPGEAEWLLDVLESLFDFYFVRPTKLAKRKAELNQKLAAAGKPPMK